MTCTGTATATSLGGAVVTTSQKMHFADAFPAKSTGAPQFEHAPTRAAYQGAVVSGVLLRALRIGPVDVEELAARLVDSLIGVRSEEVALRLDDVRRQALRSICIEVR